MSDVAERERNQVAGAHFTASVDIQMSDAGAAAKCLRRFEVGECRKNRQVVILRNFLLVIENHLAVIPIQQYFLFSRQSPCCARFKEMNLASSGFGSEPDEWPESFRLQKFTGRYGYEIWV